MDLLTSSTFRVKLNLKKISGIEGISGKKGIKRGGKKNEILDSSPLEEW